MAERRASNAEVIFGHVIASTVSLESGHGWEWQSTLTTWLNVVRSMLATKMVSYDVSWDYRKALNVLTALTASASHPARSGSVSSSSLLELMAPAHAPSSSFSFSFPLPSFSVGGMAA